jgi:hypothetical protein
MSANEVLQELSRVARANMLDYVRIGPQGDPVLDFSSAADRAAPAIATCEDRAASAKRCRKSAESCRSKVDAK